MGFIDSMIKTLKANKAIRGRRSRTSELLNDYNQKHTSGRRKINLSEINERLQYRKEKEQAELLFYKKIILFSGSIFLIILLFLFLK